MDNKNLLGSGYPEDNDTNDLEIIELEPQPKKIIAQQNTQQESYYQGQQDQNKGYEFSQGSTKDFFQKTNQPDDDPKVEKEPLYQKCELLYNDDDVPVFIIKQIFNQEQQPVDMNQPIFDRMGRQINVLLEEDPKSFGMGEYYDSMNLPLWPIKKMLVYMPLKGIFDRYNNVVYSDRREDGSVLYDKLGRPIYPVSGPMGDFFDQGHYVYPALGPTGKVYYTQNKLEVKPSQIQLFDKNGKPVYPYSEVDETALDPKPIETYDPYNQHQMNYMDQQYTPYADQVSQPPLQNTENDEEQEEDIGFKAWCKDPRNKPKLYALIIACILFVFVAGYGLFALFGDLGAKFELVQDTVNYELDKEMKLNIEDFLGKGYPQDVEVIMDKNLVYNKQKKTFTDRGKNTVSLGEYDVEFKYEKASLKAKMIVEDTTNPVIEGPNSVEMGIRDYTESLFLNKFEITDASSMTVTVENYGKNLLKEGTYQVDIIAKDSVGNKATKPVTLTVKKSAKQLAEEEKKAQEEQAKKAKEEAERKAKEEAERKAKEEAEAKRLQEEQAKKEQEEKNALQQQIENMQQTIENLKNQQNNNQNTEDSNNDVPFSAAWSGVKDLLGN